MSFKVIVTVDGKESSNQLRFYTSIEAEKYANHLMMKWNAVQKTRIAVSDDEVNCEFTGEFRIYKELQCTTK